MKERRRRATEGRARAIREAVRRLADYSRRHGANGRFLLYGSALRGDVHRDSDLDVLLDFPSGADEAAFDFAEGVCFELGVPLDACSLAAFKPKFRAEVLARAQAI